MVYLNSICHECGNSRKPEDIVVELALGEWAHENCFVGYYSSCCGAVINTETGFCSKCRN